MIALCHPNRPHLAKGLCTQCYQRMRKKPEDYTEILNQYKALREQRLIETGLRRQRTVKPAEGYNRRYRFRRLYGITVEDYDKMYEEQQGCCALCSEPKPSGGKNGLYVDHNHDTGKVRQLLCAGCNSLVGVLETRIQVLPKALAYIMS